MNTRRLFVALPLPEPVQRLLVGLRAGRHEWRWTPVEQLHLTLRFLGDVNVALIEPLIERLRAIHVESFPLPLEGAGAFPPQGAARVLWVGVGDGHPRLHQLRQRIDDTILTLGIDLDVRTFHPHVTMARCVERPARGPQPWLHAHRDFTGPVFTVEAFHLYASELHARGAVHTVLGRFPLQTTAVARPTTA